MCEYGDEISFILMHGLIFVQDENGKEKGPTRNKERTQTSNGGSRRISKGKWKH